MKNNNDSSGNNNYRENKELPKLEKRGRVAGLIFSFVAMIALVGAFSYTQYESPTEDLAESEEDSASDTTPLVLESEEVNGSQIVNDEESLLEENDVASSDDEVSSDVTENAELEDSSLEVAQEDNASTITNASIQDQLSFGIGQTMLWPIEGETIMWYSMGQAIYFETLDQYKLNDAMIIAGEAGTEVLAGAMGTVLSITEEAETGTTITIDLGSDYSVVYGQLTDVRVTEGSLVEKGQIIGVLAEPTKYYSLEGCNLYLQVLEDGVPVDPFIFLE